MFYSRPSPLGRRGSSSSLEATARSIRAEATAVAIFFLVQTRTLPRHRAYNMHYVARRPTENNNKYFLPTGGGLALWLFRTLSW